MFTSNDLLGAVVARFGQPELRLRVAPGGNAAAKDAELAKIARSVIVDFQEAAQQAGLWPLEGTWPPGSVSPLDGATDISGDDYADIWPEGMLQRAIDLFDARSYNALEVVPTGKLKLLDKSEAFLLNVAKGTMGLGTISRAEPSSPTPIATRDRAGRALIGDGSKDRRNTLDTFRGGGWDYL